MPTWPASLPQRVLADGYQETAPRFTIRTQMDAGPAQVRRRFTAGPTPLWVQLRLTFAQKATLDAFYLNDCAGGALPFAWVHPVSRAAVTMRFEGEITYSSAKAGYITAGMGLEILP